MLGLSDTIESHMSRASKTTSVPGLFTSTTNATTALGVCTSPQLKDGALGKLYKCQSALFYQKPPMSPTTKAAGLKALADLRAARTELRRLKRCWRSHYELSELQTVLDLSSRTDQGISLNSDGGSTQIPRHLTHVFRRSEGYSAVPEVQSGHVKEVSGLLRRRLIEDGFADSKMIDDQMAHDLGL
jgi:hypothetical protein